MSDEIRSSGGWAVPTGSDSPIIKIPAVSVRHGGIRWPKTRYYVRHDPGLFTGWRVISEQVGTSVTKIEARFRRRKSAERLAKALNQAAMREASAGPWPTA